MSERSEEADAAHGVPGMIQAEIHMPLSATVKEEDSITPLNGNSKTEQEIATQKQTQQRLLKIKKTTALSNLTKKKGYIVELLDNMDNLHIVKDQMTIYQQLANHYQECYDSYIELLTDETDIHSLENRHEEKLLGIIGFKTKVQAWIHQQEVQLCDTMSQNSSCRSSRRSGRSSNKSNRSSCDAKARLAELLVEKQMIQKQQEIKKMQLDIDIAKAKARSEVFEEDIPTIKQRDIPRYTSQPDASPLVVELPEEPKIGLLSSPAENFNKQFAETQRLMTTALLLPSPQLPTFCGDVMEYRAFVMAFDVRIAPRIESCVDKLYYLDQHLVGEPKELIGGCLYMKAEEGYETARGLLDKEYGDSFKVATAYINKVFSWPQIKHDDARGLRQFSLFLTKCRHAMESVNDMTVLNHIPNIQSVIKKLPQFLQNKWAENAVKQRESGKNVSFKDVVDFVFLASQIANDAAFGKNAMHCNLDSTKKFPQGSFSTQISQVECVLCNGNHDLDDCHEFRKYALAERRDFIRDKCLCFSCYSANHFSRSCTNRRSCKVCTKPHPTALHDYQFGRPVGEHRTETINEDVESKATSTSDPMQTYCDNNSNREIVLQPIIPVLVQHGRDGKQMKTYALYDNGSTGCFMSDELHDQLGCSSREATLNIRTMHGESRFKTKVSSNLIVSDLNAKNPVTLPKTYVKDIPVNKDQIPRPEFICQWPHLKEISGEIAEFMPKLNIGLLIGSNCPLALQPIRVIPTEENSGPYAVMYKHGWTINGPLKLNFKGESIECHRVILQEVESTRECFAPEISRLFEQDFAETRDVPEELGYSQEDRKFLKIIEEGIKKENNHYTVPFPFKDSECKLENNRHQALQRLVWQQKKMEKNAQYHQDYVDFVTKLTNKGYAYKIPTHELKAKEGKTWYLPHHGVYHQKKNKLRVVFDCSANYRGRSLNGMLLQGPDMTNSLVGVLTRFRQEPVAFMGDIESMFYQVKVPLKDHDYLRFLWWPNGDYHREVEEYRMSVHIFGAISSPSVSNYALKRCAQEASNQHDQQVTSTILNNFYVDDCLRSVPDEQTAIQLIRDVTAVCASGGFRLTKFTSNNQRVLDSIAEEDRSTETREKTLEYDHECTERAY